MAAPLDTFGLTGGDIDDPASDAFAVTPHDTTYFTKPARALYIGGAGNVVVVTPKGNAITFVGVAAGSILPVRCYRVNSTSTTATSIVGLV